MDKVTAEQIRESVIKNNVSFLPIHDCSICGTFVGYYFFRYPPYEVVFDSSCSCGCSHPHPSSFEDVAGHINMQTNEKYINELLTLLGINNG